MHGGRKRDEIEAGNRGLHCHTRPINMWFDSGVSAIASGSVIIFNKDTQTDGGQLS